MAAGGRLAPMASFRRPALAWATATDDERRFQRIATSVLLLVLTLGVVVPWLPLPRFERLEAQPLPAPMARLLLERSAPPPAPPPAAAEAATTPEPARPAEPTPKAQASKPETPVPDARQPVPGKPPGEAALDKARRKASGVGLLALKDELAALSGAPLAVQLRQDLAPGPGLGSGAGPGVGAGTEAGIPVRALITASAGKGSGGINTAAYSRDTGGGGLAGRATTLVEGAGGGGGGGGGGRAGATGAAGAGGSSGAGGTLHKAGSGKASRSIEEIKLVFERHKGAIYALYNRALRDDPALQGKVVLELKIAPAGQVEALRIVSSELKAEELERKLLARIRQFDFGAKDVEVMVVTWPVDFLPS
jgi:TonB family protein